MLKTPEVMNIARLALETAQARYDRAVHEGATGSELAEHGHRLDQAQRIHAAAEAWGVVAC